MESQSFYSVFGFYCLFLVFVSNNVDSLVVEGDLTTKEDWQFLTRFCFLSHRGRLQFEFVYPADFSPEDILLYFDDQWPLVYGKPTTCAEKVAVLRPENNQIIRLDTTQFWSGCAHNDSETPPMLRCNASRTFSSARERWWYVVASKCGNLQGLRLHYKITMTNADPGDLFFRQFSADEFYILQVDISFLVIFVIMCCLSVAVAFELRTRQLFHTTYKMYMASLLCQVLFLLIVCVAYGTFANTGFSNRGLRTFGRAFESVGSLIFLLMLILMAKGYTITRGRLSYQSTVKIAIFTTIYIITYIVLFIYEAVFFDPGLVIYLYESPAGYGLVGLKLLGWLWFCYAIFFTLKHYPEKSSFYYPFFIFYTLWFWTDVIIILTANLAMPMWIREKVVNGVSLTLAFIGHLFFLVLTRPGAANKNFPYHVRTSQIGVMANAPHETRPGVTQSGRDPSSFANHAYAPDNGAPPPYAVAMTAPNFTELFTVANTHSKGGRLPPAGAQQNVHTNGAPGNGYHAGNGYAAEAVGGEQTNQENNAKKANPFITQS